MMDVLFLLCVLILAATASLFFFSLVMKGVDTGSVPVRWLTYHQAEEPFLFWSSMLMYLLAGMLFAAIPAFVLWELLRSVFM
jgi:hypothetical protein